MANTLSKINSCDADQVVCNIIEMQLNDEYHVQNDIWYKEEDDFTTNERGGSISSNLEDATPSGACRTKQKVVNFTETKDLTFGEDFNSCWLQLLHQVQLQNDEYQCDFLNCGINMRKTTCFADGSKTIVTYTGLTVLSIDKVFEQLDSADNEVALSLEVGDEPKVQCVGFSACLPEEFTEVTADITPSYLAPDLTVTITNVVDPDVLVLDTVLVGEEWRVDVYDSDDILVATQFTDNALLTPVVFNALPIGDYTISTAYHYFTDSSSVRHYRYIDTQEFTIV